MDGLRDGGAGRDRGQPTFTVRNDGTATLTLGR